jgi:hypothetical protein
MGTDEGAHKAPNFPALVIDVGHDELEVGGAAEVSFFEIALAFTVVLAAGVVVAVGLLLFWWFFKV